MATDNFIRVYNTFFNSIEEQSEKYLTSDELLTYLLLDNEIDMYRKGGTYSYEYILENMKKKNSKENRENFIKSVKSLETKGIVKIQKEGKTYIKLEINHEDIECSEQYSFEKLYISEFRRLYDSTKMKVEEIHIYLLIKSESRMDKRAFLSYSLIAKKLNVSRSTAQRLIKAMLKKGSIKMQESKSRKAGSVEFENNEYFCNLQTSEEMMKIQEEEKKKDLEAKEKKKAEIRTFKVGQFSKPQKEEQNEKINNDRFEHALSGELPF